MHFATAQPFTTSFYGGTACGGAALGTTVGGFFQCQANTFEAAPYSFMGLGYVSTSAVYVRVLSGLTCSGSVLGLVTVSLGTCTINFSGNSSRVIGTVTPDTGFTIGFFSGWAAPAR